MREARWTRLLIVLAVLAAARAALAFVPGTWGWSLAHLRFAPPVPGWALWAVAAIALWPLASRAQAPLFARLGRALEGAPRLGALPVAALVAGVVFVLADHTWFTGDFLLRRGVIESTIPRANVTPQSLPLDLWLHIDLPRRLAAIEWIADPVLVVRALGAIVAGLLAWVALVLGAEEGEEAGASRLAFAAVLLGGSLLTLTAGYGKTAGELALLTLLVDAFARRLVRTGRGAIPLGLTLAIALLLHRSALLLVPPLAAAWIVASRTGVAPRGWIARVVGIGAPLLVLVALAPKLAGLLWSFDVPRHLAGDSPGGGGPLGVLAPLALLDRLNVVLAWAPLAALLAIPLRAHDDDAARHTRGVAWAWAPALAMLLAVQPQQGLFRDWDVFAIPGTLVAIATARRAARWIGSGERVAERLAPVLWAAVAGAGLWLMVGHDERAGLARVRAFVVEPPQRAEPVRGKLWEFLGDRAAELRRWDDAADALRHAVVYQPSPRLYQMLSMAESEVGHPEAAERAMELAARRSPGLVTAWAAWVLLSLQRGNTAGAREAARGLQRIAPDHPLVRQVLGDSAAVAR